MRVLCRDADPLELSDDACLNSLVDDDDVTWLGIAGSSCSTLNDRSSFGLGTVGNPSFDDDIACNGQRRRLSIGAQEKVTIAYVVVEATRAVAR